MPEKVICNRILDESCKQTANCCLHCKPHEIGDTCTTINCRFAPDGIAGCVPLDQMPLVPAVPEQKPQQQPVTILSPEPVEETQILEPEESAKQEEAVKPVENVEEKKAVPAKKKGGRSA
jgi:hypothetical protein